MPHAYFANTPVELVCFLAQEPIWALHANSGVYENRMYRENLWISNRETTEAKRCSLNFSMFYQILTIIPITESILVFVSELLKTKVIYLSDKWVFMWNCHPFTETTAKFQCHITRWTLTVEQTIFIKAQKNHYRYHLAVSKAKVIMVSPVTEHYTQCLKEALTWQQRTAACHCKRQWDPCQL